MGKHYNFFKFLKSCRIKACEIKAKEVDTKKLFVNKVPLNPTTLKEVTEREELVAVNFPQNNLEATNIQFSETYAVRGVEEFSTCGAITEDHRYPLQTVSVQIEVDNDLSKLQEIEVFGVLGYTIEKDVSGGIEVVGFIYDSTTRTWVETPTDIKSLALNSLKWKNSQEKVVNLQTYITLTNQENCDVLQKQNELTPGCGAVPPAGSLKSVQYLIFMKGILSEGPFEPLIRTQYSGTYTHEFLCEN